MAKLLKEKCEIFDCKICDPKILHLHHIIDRAIVGTSNKPQNLAILCPTHHSMVHTGTLIIHGVMSSTMKPNNRTLIYTLNGEKNIDIEIPEYVSTIIKMEI